MTIYEKIDADLENRGMSRRQLALNAGIAPSTATVNDGTR